MKVDYTDPVVRLLIPRYNELAPFLMSISFILALFTYDGLQTTLYKFFFDHFDPRKFLVLLFFFWGILFSLYHVFTKRQKTDLEKRIMLFFAVIVSAYSGIAAGIYIIKDIFDILTQDISVIQLAANSILMLFPVWNIFNGFWLLLLLRVHIIDENNITDENATLFQVLLGLMILLLVFLVCRAFIELHWTLTLSICVGCATSVSGIVQESLSESQSN